MDTIEDLQALVTEIEQTVDFNATVNIYLPAVTYEGGMVLSGHAVNLYGSTEGEARTAFTGTTQVTHSQWGISYFYDIDFIGNGTGVLLERVPSDQTLVFNDCLFSRNGTDIDNRCGQAVDITEAVFE